MSSVCLAPVRSIPRYWLLDRNDPLISDRYLFYYLKGPQFQEVALRRITGSATPHLFQKDIKGLRVAVPPMREQQRIGEKVQKLLGRVESCQQRLAYVSLC